MNDLPAIRFALPINSEHRWSDMLATLVATDPLPLCHLLGLDPTASIEVQREPQVDSSNRPDMILRAHDRAVAVIEVKVLAGLGPRQLARYEEAEPHADKYVVLFPERLVVDTNGAPRWRAITWEQVLTAFAGSDSDWVRASARAWLAHLADALPEVDGETRWNDLEDGTDFVIAMRARASWVFSNLRPPPSIEHDLVTSAAGASAVVRLFRRAATHDYWVIAEMEERLAVRNIPKFANAASRPPIGPSLRVSLLQEGVSSSANFDWDYLLSMWPLMAAARTDWVTTSARPKHEHDKANHRAMVTKGGPKYLGIGFGERQTRINGQCMFGARVQLPADISLRDLTNELQGTAALLMDMSVVPPPSTPRVQDHAAT